MSPISFRGGRRFRARKRQFEALRRAEGSQARLNRSRQGNMGEKRRRLVREHGYDTKNAAHLVRLLRMCKEFLRTGEMKVWREDDAEELKAIKSGHWSLEAVKQLAEHLFVDIRVEREASTLPYEPDVERISDVLVALHCLEYGWTP